MDSDISALAAEAGRAIVHAMLSDAWATVRPRLAAVIGRAGASALAALDADRQALAKHRLNRETAIGRWEARIEALLEPHPELAADLRALLAEIGQGRAPTAVHQAMRGIGGSGFQAGRDIRDSGNTTTDNSRKSYGGIVAVVAVVAVLLVVGVGVVNNIVLPAIKEVGGPSITADTPCREYLQASYAEREQAVQRIAVEIEVSGAGSPFLILNVDDQCGNQLDTPVGDVIGRQRY